VWFLGFLAFALLWVLGYGLELVAATFQWKLFWTRVQFVGIPLLPLAWLLLVIRYLDRPVSAGVQVAAVIVPTITIILAVIAPLPNWFWGQPGPSAFAGSIGRIDYDYRWWFYYVHAPYGYVLLVATMVMLVRGIARVHREYRSPLVILLVALLIPTVSDIAYVLGYAPFPELNPTSMVMGISGLLMGIVLYRYRFLDIVPVARSTVFETMTDGVVVIDDHRIVIDANPAVTQICGCTTIPVGHPVGEMFPPAVSTAIAEMLAGDTALREVTLPDPGCSTDDPGRVYEIRRSPLHHRNGRPSGAILVLREVTERVRLYERVRELSMVDELTGIYNRRSFLEAGTREIELIRRTPETFLGVLLVDLDNFKEINDTFGHQTGDIVLRRVVEAIRESIRTIDIPGRIGGDEFVVILPGADATAAHRAGERLGASIEALSLKFSETPVTVTASIGVATLDLFRPRIPTLEELLSAADDAMYRAKRSGKNRVR